MHTAGALPGDAQLRLDRYMKLCRGTALAHGKDMHFPLRGARRMDPDFAHVHDAGKNGPGGREVRNAQGDRAEALDLMLGRHRAFRPRMGLAAVVGHQPETLAFRVLEIDRGVAGAVLDRGWVCAGLAQAGEPKGQTCRRNPEAGAGDRVGTAPFGRRGPIKESKVGAGRGNAVAIEQVVGASVVLVDRLLDQPHAEGAGVKAEIGRRLGGDRRQVVDAAQLQAHRSLLKVVIAVAAKIGGQGRSSESAAPDKVSSFCERGHGPPVRCQSPIANKLDSDRP